MFFLLFWPLLQLATVSGKVTSAQTGEPIAHAQVWIEPDGLPDEARHALTDAEGNYEIRDLNPGDYGIRCVKAGYIQGQATPDHRWPTRSTPITLAEKQIVKDADCKLSRGGSISGSVTDQDGEPLSGVEVQLMIRNYQHGRAELEREEEMQTDDHGNYRFYDLPKGRYYIGAGGRMGNPNELNYDPIVYPNGSRLADAQVMALAAGAEIAGINLTMRPGKAYQVAGKVTGAVDLSSRVGQMSQLVMNVRSEDTLGTQGASLVLTDGSFGFGRLAAWDLHLVAGKKTRCSWPPAAEQLQTNSGFRRHHRPQLLCWSWSHGQREVAHCGRRFTRQAEGILVGVYRQRPGGRRYAGPGESGWNL